MKPTEPLRAPLLLLLLLLSEPSASSTLFDEAAGRALLELSGVAPLFLYFFFAEIPG